jgi:hypothetical protein
LAEPAGGSPVFWVEAAAKDGRMGVQVASDEALDVAKSARAWRLSVARQIFEKIRARAA